MPPKHRRKSKSSQRTLLALCTAPLTVTGGVALAQTGFAEPEPTLEEIKDQVDELYHEAEQATERYNAATDELAEVERRVERAESSVSKQEEKVDEALASMAGFATAAYQNGGVDPTLRTLVADDPEEFLNEASVLDAYAKQQEKSLDKAAEMRLELEQVRLVAEQEREQLAAVEETLENEKQNVEENLAEAEEILEQLEEEERRRLEEIERREREKEEESRSDDREPPPDVPASGKGKVAVDFAMAQVGEPYVWGGNGPDSWDCSGLTKAAWAQAGVSISRSSTAQINDGTRVASDQLQPGDLVFYYSPISHVGVYIGDGKMVHATHPGDVVSVDPVFGHMPYAGATRPG